MRWETTVSISAVLVMATSALHLTMEHDLLADHPDISSSDIETTTKQNIVHIVSGSKDVDSADTNGDQIDKASLKKPSQSILVEQDTISNKSEETISRSKENNDKNNMGSITPHSGRTGSKSTESSELSENDRENQPVSDDDGINNCESDADNCSIDGPETDDDNINECDSGADNCSTNEHQTDDSSENGDEDGNENEDDDEEDIITDSPPEGDDNEMIVETTTGRVRGHAWRENAQIIGFIDIKYGIFKNHFEAPVLPDLSETIHDEKDHSKRCPQLQDDKYVGDMDCLTLSIFKPSKAVSASVLVHIHEGNFINESANPAIYGPEYLVSKEIILVLPNYRLGPLGFLCLQNETAPGNAALKDLALALSWIKANIAKFGGDPENIAVSGDGTAGALAGYLALSPMSKSYVRKVITESGSVLSHWAIDRNPIVAATNLANNINEFQSWQDIDTSALVTAAKNIVWRPCLERNNTNDTANFMVETPLRMIEKEETKVTFMIGSAKYAGVHESLNHTTASIQQLNDDVSFLLPNDLQFKTSEERSRVGNQVKAQYFGDEAICLCDVENRTLYYTDVAYLGPGIRTARSLVNSGATVYFYEFSFVGKLNRELEAVQKPVDGAVRGDIIGYLFTQDGVVPAENSKERRMVDLLITLWTTFLKKGEPSAENIEWNKWENVTATEEQWLSIETEPTLKKGLHVDRLSLWTSIYNEHFIERSLALGTSPSVYTVLALQVIFFISFFRNAWHFF